MPRELHKYGTKWPDGFTPIDIELYCFGNRWGQEEGALGPYRHFRNISKVLWPDMAWHQWAKDRIAALCAYRTNAWTGAGACGKTWDAGHFAMLFWLADPMNTSVILTSTTGDMVRKRIWPVIQELFHTAKAVPVSQILRDGFPGNLVDSKTTLQAQKGDDKHGIFAKAVRQGSTAKAVADIQGIHSKRMLIVVDEATDTPEAMFEAIPNLRKGCEDFNLLVIGNPISHLDPHGLACQPAEGWNSITVESESWPTAGIAKWEIEPGMCLHFDGTKSPNIKEGFTKYPFLITREDVDRATGKDSKAGQESVGFWKFTRGFWAPEGLCNTVLSEALVERFKADGEFKFVSKRTPIGSLDPAFGGDRCILKFGFIGDIDTTGKLGVQLGETIEIMPSVKKKDPIDHQIAHRVMEECKKRLVTPESFGMDSTGVGRGVAAILENEWGSIRKVEFGTMPTERPASTDDTRPSREVYDRRVTELWYSVKELVTSEQLKGLSREEIIEFCHREYHYEGRKLSLDTKEECKKKLGRSPDHADAVAVLVDVGRALGIAPNTKKVDRVSVKILELARKSHSIYDPDNMFNGQSAVEEPEPDYA